MGTGDGCCNCVVVAVVDLSFWFWLGLLVFDFVSRV